MDGRTDGVRARVDPIINIIQRNTYLHLAGKSFASRIEHTLETKMQDDINGILVRFN